MTITDMLRPHLREAATKLAEGDIVGLCELNYKHFDGTPEYAALAQGIRHRIAHPTSAAWKQHRPERRSVYVVKNLLPPAMVTSCPETAVWHRILREYRVIGALRWYRWALRTCQLADRTQKDGINVDSLQQ